ncbi:hypothetical protein CgunFtcFv8_024779 [Champsocephalus gunnari]|uniref:OSK domain-containing protein n=1 Tax=Champsocephalus gunnari TaxID=52237 RepID=A0AAN8DFW3_CHAGU|nr:hypothetical protein CgunFtcFv8_024779 [Champsocephalus gunnari]
MVSDLAEKILHIGAEHPTVKNVVLLIGTNDVVKQQSEVLKEDFKCLLETVSSLNAEVFISGPLPPVRRGVERCSRLFALNTWLSTVCTDHSVNCIDNFYFFWDRRHLFKANGVCLNKSGVKLFISNIFNCLRHQSVPSAKDKRQEESKQKKDTTHCADNPEEVSLHPPEECSDYGRPMTQMEESPLPVTLPVNAFEDTLHSSPKLSTPSPFHPAPPLEFDDRMKATRRVGSMSFTPAPQRRPPKSPKQRRASSPPASSPCLPQSSKPKQYKEDGSRFPNPPSYSVALTLPSYDERSRVWWVLPPLQSLIGMCVYKTLQTDIFWVQAQGRMALSTLSRTCRGPACL